MGKVHFRIRSCFQLRQPGKLRTVICCDGTEYLAEVIPLFGLHLLKGGRLITSRPINPRTRLPPTWTLLVDSTLIVVPNQPMQTLQTPEEDAFLFPQQLVHQKWIIRSACGPVFGSQHDLAAEEAIGLVVQGGQRTVSEAEEAHIQLALVALDALALHVYLALGGHDGLDIVGLGQGAHIHIVIHHQELVFQVCATEPVALHLLDAGGIHAVTQQGAHDQSNAAFVLAALADEYEHLLPLGSRQWTVAEKLLQGGNIIFLQQIR